MSQPPPRPPWNYSELFIGCSEYIFRQTNISCHPQLCNNHIEQQWRITSNWRQENLKQSCFRSVQFFCLLHISKLLLPSVQIKSMLYIKYTHSLFCLKLRNIVCFPGSEEKRVSSTHYLDWKHYKVTMGLMPWQSEMSPHCFNCVRLRVVDSRTKLVSPSPQMPT